MSRPTLAFLLFVATLSMGIRYVVQGEHTGVIAIPRQTVSSSEGFHFTSGESIYYSYELVSSLGTEYTNASENHEIKSKLYARILDNEGPNSWLGMQFYEVSYLVGRKRSVSMEQVLASPFLVHLDANGRLLELFLSETLSEQERLRLKGFVSPLFVENRSGEQKSWQATESDATGTFMARYQRLSDTQVERAKLEYLTLASEAGVISKVSLNPSRTVFRVLSEHSWLDRLEGSESLQLVGAGALRIQAKLNSKLYTIAANEINPEWKEYSSTQMRQWLQNLKGSEPSQSASKSLVTLTPKPDESSLQLIEKLGAQNRPEEILNLTTKLAELSKVDRETLQEILGQLRSSDSSDLLCANLIYALQKANTSEAQAVLAEIAQSADDSLENQKRAIISLGFMTLSDNAEKVLWNLYAHAENEAAAAKSEMALLSLGTLGDTLATPAPARSSAIQNKIAAYLDDAALRNEYQRMSAALLALGNTAQPDSLNKVVEYLRNESSVVRVAAAKAMTGIHSEDTQAYAREHLLEEDSAQVRSALVDVLVGSQADLQTYQAAQQLLLEEDENTVRLKLAKYIAANAHSFPQGQGALKALIEEETEPAVYKILLEGLAD